MSTGRILRGTTRIHPEIPGTLWGTNIPDPCNVGDTPYATLFTHDAQRLLSSCSYRRDHSIRDSLWVEFKATSSYQSFYLYTSNIISPDITLVKREIGGAVREYRICTRIYAVFLHFFEKAGKYRLTLRGWNDIINCCIILRKHFLLYIWRIKFYEVDIGKRSTRKISFFL